MKKKLLSIGLCLLLILMTAVPAMALVSEAPATAPKAPINWLSMIGISLVIGAVIALIVVLIMKSGMKSVYRQGGAAQYAKEGRVTLTAKNDVFLYCQITKTPRPKPQEQQRP